MFRLRANQRLVRASLNNDNQLTFSSGVPKHVISDWHILFFNHKNILIGEGTYENPIVIMEQEPKFNRLIESTMVAVIETELVLLTEELSRLCSRSHVSPGRYHSIPNDKRGKLYRSFY